MRTLVCLAALLLLSYGPHLAAQARGNAAQDRSNAAQGRSFPTSRGDAPAADVAPAVAAPAADVAQGRGNDRDAEGTLEIFYEDSPNGNRLHHFLNTGTERMMAKRALDR